MNFGSFLFTAICSWVLDENSIIYNLAIISLIILNNGGFFQIKTLSLNDVENINLIRADRNTLINGKRQVFLRIFKSLDFPYNCS